QNMLIMVFAEHGEYSFTLHNADYDPTLKDMPDNLVLVKQELAEVADWKAGLENAAALFGLALNKQRTPNHQSQLEKEVLDEVKRHLPAAELLVASLHKAFGRMKCVPQGNRIANAQRAVELLTGLKSKTGAALVAELANAQWVNNVNALARSITRAATVSQAIESNNWDLLDLAMAKGAAAGSMRKQLQSALEADELVTSLSQVLGNAQMEATALLRESQ